MTTLVADPMDVLNRPDVDAVVIATLPGHTSSWPQRVRSWQASC
jgi:hypothetical protein